MYLRKVILIFSFLIIAFSLSLYFQTGQDMDISNIGDFKGHKSDQGRKHNLAQINQVITPYTLEEMIEKRVAANRLLRDKTRVMEIRGGNGLAVMELKKKFPEVEFYVINRRKNHSIYRREGLASAALHDGLFTLNDIKDIDLPYLLFRDLDFGNTIPYDENKFDLIFSYSTLPLIKYKFEFLSETLRVLKNGGISIHTGPGDLNLYKSGIKMSEREVFHKLRKVGFNINYNEKILMFEKVDNNYIIPLTPHFPIPLKTEENDNKKLDMSYHLQD